MRMTTEPHTVKDLADHFVKCSKLGQHLTLQDEDRYVITDDFRTGRVEDPVATAVATVFSKDVLVAEAALVPLAVLANLDDSHVRERYEELFGLIEAQALSPEVQDAAQAIRISGFRENRIKALESDLGYRITPARKRYRAFLDITRKLMDGAISPGAFRDEFLDFTYAVAGRLDFGVYSFCMDRIFTNPVIPMDAKRLLIEELLKFPPLIRRELMSNILVSRQGGSEVRSFARQMIVAVLDTKAAGEIRLLEKFKRSRQLNIDFDEIDTPLAIGRERPVHRHAEALVS
jgi:hypothetical protein